MGDEDFLENFAALWGYLKLKQGNFSDKADWWNGEAKPNIKEFCIAFLAQKKSTEDGQQGILVSISEIGTC